MFDFKQQCIFHQHMLKLYEKESTIDALDIKTSTFLYLYANKAIDSEIIREVMLQVVDITTKSNKK